MNQSFRGKHIEYHILQSFPVTCLNRDDVGAPKTALVGGVTRARVSSQAWKRPVRMQLKELGVRIGMRTKKVAEVLLGECVKRGASPDQAAECAEALAKLLTKDTLFFFSEAEAAVFAEYAAERGFDSGKIAAKELSSSVKKLLNTAADGLDIALFGRMVAQQPDINITGAASFAHAISTHKISNEIDFFTALDDLQDEPGSAHMGSLEYNSATYYRYVSLDLGQLAENIGVEELAAAVEVFTKALYLALPIARQASQSGACPWEYAKIFVRTGQRLQASFEEPVRADTGWLKPSIRALEAFLAKKEQQGGSLFGKELEITLGPDTETSIDDIVLALKRIVS